MFTCFAVISSKSHFIIAIKLIYNKTQDAVAEKRSYPFTCYMTFYVLLKSEAYNRTQFWKIASMCILINPKRFCMRENYFACLSDGMLKIIESALYHKH